MRYARFDLVTLTSTTVVFDLMYLNSYQLKHVFSSEIRLTWLC